MPSVSVAFDEFSRKALCQESIFFLKDVTKFQCDGYSDAVDDGGGEDGVGGSKFAAFTELVLRYIVDGAPDEVNISSGNKDAIVGVYEAGQLAFYGLPSRERRFVFANAYAEVRFVLESNLMAKFISTDGFKNAMAEDRARNSD
ncbi:unnamed protein product [Ectocarpus sp. 8 AP-2014]